MRLFLSLVALLSVSLSVALQAGTISSVPAGGDWTAPATWVGGVVPGPNDDVIINGTVAATTTTVRSVTVSTGATLTGMGGPQWLTVTGTFTNNGSLVINSGNWGFVIYSRGSVVNNGVWRITALEFKDNTTFYIGGTGVFEGESILKADSNAILKATSDLKIGCRMELTGQNWSWTKLDLQQHSLTLDGSTASYRAGSLTGSVVSNVRDIIIRKNGFLENVSMTGEITLRDSAALGANVHLYGTIVNEGKLTITGGPKHVYIHGPFTNNGNIIPNPDNWSFVLNLEADFHNNGGWNPSRTVVVGERDVTFSHADGRPFEGDVIEIPDTVGTLIAGSDIEMRGALVCTAPDWKWWYVDMRNHTLTLDGRRGSYLAGVTDRLVIQNAHNIILRKNALLQNVALYGDVHFYDSVVIGGNTSVIGSLVNHDTLRGGGGPNYLKIYGSFRNEGYVSWHPDKWGFEVQLRGDLTEAGRSENISYNIITEDQIRRITGPVMTRVVVNYNMVDKLGGSADVIGELTTNTDLQVTRGSTMRITSGGVLTSNANLNIDYPGKLIIEGTLVQQRKINNAAVDLNLTTAFLRIPAATGVDSLIITCRSAQSPSSFANAVKRWWTLTSIPEAPAATATLARLYLGDAPMNGNVFNTLQVYHSDDSGLTWRQITTDISIRRDSIGMYLEITDAPLSGSFVLSSKPDPYSVQPGILVNIVGSDAIRIGAPNRLTFVATNVGPAVTQSTLLPIYLGSQLHILGADVVLAGGGRRTLSKADVASGTDDSTTMFLLAPLEPGEQAVIDLIITADAKPNGFKNGDDVQIEPVTMIVGGTVICWVGGKIVGWVAGKAIDYVGDKASEGVQLTDAERKKYAQALGVTEELVRIKKTERGWVVWGAKELGSEAAQQMSKVGLPIEIGGAVAENIHKKVAPSLRQRIFYWLYKETGLIKPDQPVENGQKYVPQVSGIARKQGRAVTSRDPNEKVGITGIGTNGFLGSVCPMIYQVKFENVKTAEAAAYKIVVVDTLDPAVFDLSTIRMLRTSHPGATFTTSNNVLRWEWIGIDLPPNVNPPEGEGYVEFEVRLKSGLASGTQIKNAATITFDMNDPIRTNTWINTLDFTPPATRQLRVSLISSDSVSCAFTADDGSGSGAEVTSIYMAQGSGTFALGDVLPYTGAPMRIGVPAGLWQNMRFYALSTDAVGNIETTPQEIVGITTSVDEEQLEVDGIVASPHPVRDMLSIRRTDGLPIGAYRVFNMTGALIASGTGDVNVEIPLRGYATGIYLLITNDRTLTFVKE